MASIIISAYFAAVKVIAVWRISGINFQLLNDDETLGSLMKVPTTTLCIFNVIHGGTWVALSWVYADVGWGETGSANHRENGRICTSAKGDGWNTVKLMEETLPLSLVLKVSSDGPFDFLLTSPGYTIYYHLFNWFVKDTDVWWKDTLASDTFLSRLFKALWRRLMIADWKIYNGFHLFPSDEKSSHWFLRDPRICSYIPLKKWGARNK